MYAARATLRFSAALCFSAQSQQQPSDSSFGLCFFNVGALLFIPCNLSRKTFIRQ